MRILFLLFVIVPLIEMWLLIEVGRVIGAPLTILAVAFTAIVGVALLKRQGVDTLSRANQKMAQGELPASEVFEGLLLAVGGALLLTPGFVTDILGFSCLLPASRKYWARTAFKYWASNVQMSGAAQWTQSRSTSEHGRSSRPQHGDLIDGEYRRDDDSDREKRNR